MKRMRKQLVLLLYCLFKGILVHGQVQQLTLHEAIRISQENSFDYKVSQNRLQGSIWRFENHKTSFLPTLYIDGNVPNYTRAINKITMPTGEDTFVSQNQAYSSTHIGIRQNVGLTGGVLSVNSYLNRIDVFGDQRHTRYSSTPFSISYNQQTIGYNSFKWQNRIEPLHMESARRQFRTDMERIAGQVVLYFFNTLSAKARFEMSQQNHASIDTLNRITKERFRLGNVTQSTLLQLKLNKLNAQKQLTRDSVDYILARQQFARYLQIKDVDGINLVFEEDVRFFDVSYHDALKYANENSQNVINYKLQKAQAEHEIAHTRAQTGLKFNVSMNFGITNTSNTLGDIFNGVQNQQQVSIGFSAPILDWGFSKTQRQRSEANLAMVENEIEQWNLQVEEEIALYTARWQLQNQQLTVAKEARDIAIQNYNLELDRFLRGNISINDLNASQQQKDYASNAYIDAVRGYWDTYFTIRRLTLYDFWSQRKL